MCNIGRCNYRKASSVETLLVGAHWNAIQTAFAPLTLSQPLHLPISRMSSSDGWCLTNHFEMLCLFLGQTEFHAVIMGEKEAADSIVWSDTLKRSLICGLNGCLRNYNKPFVSTEEPSHLTYCSLPIQSVRRGWQEERRHWRTTVLSHRTGQRNAGGSLLSYAATPLALDRLSFLGKWAQRGWGQTV